METKQTRNEPDPVMDALCLRSRVADLERTVADLERQNKELREAVAALLK